MLWNITPLDCCLHLSFSHFPTPLLVLQLWKRNLLILFHTQFPLPHLPGSTGKKNHNSFTSKREWDFSLSESWELWHILWLPERGGRLFIYLWSLCLEMMPYWCSLSPEGVEGVVPAGWEDEAFSTDFAEWWGLALIFEEYSSGFYLHFVQIGSDCSDGATPLLVASYVGQLSWVDCLKIVVLKFLASISLYNLKSTESPKELLFMWVPSTAIISINIRYQN